MNPDKLFAYLDDTLDQTERADIDRRLEVDSQLQRELAIAREIHKRARGQSREVIFHDEVALSARGRKMALRVGAGFIILIALNVLIGLLVIAHKEASNPNRKLLDQQMRDQLSKSLTQAAQMAMTPPPLGVSDIMLSAASGKMNSVADQVVAAASRAGGSATKGLPNDHDINVLADLPANREAEFRTALATISGGAPPATPTNETTATEKKSFVVHVVEPGEQQSK